MDKFASALHWVLEDTCHIHHLIHYLDDFLNVSPPSLPLAQHQKSLLLDLFAYLQVPVAPEKVDGPSTVLTFLGLELGTMALEIRLPPSKLTKLSTTVSTLVQSGRAQKRDLAAVLGQLSFTSRAVPAGRTDTPVRPGQSNSINAIAPMATHFGIGNGRPVVVGRGPDHTEWEVMFSWWMSGHQPRHATTD